MRTLLVRRIVAGIVVVLVFLTLSCAHTRPRPVDITGNYILYREGEMFGKVVGYMNISSQRGGQFSIGITVPTGNPAMDWQGSGEIMGNRGFYSWKFDDGKQGRTTFTIDKAGNLHGHVQGSGINWKYVARRE